MKHLMTLLLAGLLFAFAPHAALCENDTEAAYTALYEQLMQQVFAEQPELDADFWTTHPLALVMMLDLEIQNGGLAQFLWNEGPEAAAAVPSALRTLDLPAIAELYERFLSEHDITLEATQGFRTQFPDFVSLYSAYPFDAFEQVYMTCREELCLPQRVLDFAALHSENHESTPQPRTSGSWLQQLLKPATDAALLDSLRSLEICIPQELAATLRQELDSQHAELHLPPVTSQEYALQLLMVLGMGEFDPEDDSWTPTSSELYAFDTEFYDIDTMYTLFLKGVSAIVPGFTPTEITETPIEDCEASGIKIVSLSLNGHSYQHDLTYQGDWFDGDAIAWVNDVLRQEGFPGQLYACFDGLQGILLLYGDADRAEKVIELLEIAPLF